MRHSSSQHEMQFEENSPVQVTNGTSNRNLKLIFSQSLWWFDRSSLCALQRYDVDATFLDSNVPLARP